MMTVAWCRCRRPGSGKVVVSYRDSCDQENEEPCGGCLVRAAAKVEECRGEEIEPDKVERGARFGVGGVKRERCDWERRDRGV